MNESVNEVIIPITKGRSARVCACHHRLVADRSWQYHPNGYAITGAYIDGVHRVLRMHRLINDTPKGFDTDHINGDKLDNRCQNLRTATRSQNNRNSKLNARNKSGVRGVSWDTINKKWKAQISYGGKPKNLGRYTKLEDAEAAYLRASKTQYGVFHG